MRHLLFFCLWLLLLPLSVCAQYKYMFKHLEVRDGLSNNQVNAIYKDSKGFMWFGTASGLNRYDGYDIRVYRSLADDENSLPDNSIKTIQEDGENNLWLRTRAGYVIYRMSEDRFDRRVENWARNIGISGVPSFIYVDNEKNFWVFVSGQGLFYYQSGSDSAVKVENQKFFATDKEMTGFAECADGVVVVRSDGQLACVDRTSLMVKWNIGNIATGKAGEDYKDDFSLFVDRRQRIWVYAISGIWIYDLPSKNWVLQSPRQDNYNSLRALTEDSMGNMWMSRDQEGIEVIDGQGKSIHLVNIPGNERTLPDNTITALYEDEAGTMWVGTYRKGVSYYNESIYKFSTVNLGDINCVEDGGGNDVWLGTNGGGLIRWNRATGDKTVYKYSMARNSVSSDIIVSLLKTRDGKLWIGTYWGGLNCFDGQRFVHYRAGGTGTLANDNVWALVEDKDGLLWIGTLGGGLQCMDPRTGMFVTYNVQNSGLVSNFISSLCLDRHGNLVVGTSNGISIVDLESRRITGFSGTRSGHDRFANQSINQVYKDSRGLLWVATCGGLYVYDCDHDRLYDVPLKAGFSNLYILGIAEDADRNMWVSTGGELINIVLTMDDKDKAFTFRCLAYNDKDGLQGGDFNQRSWTRLHTGEMLVGGLYGINSFAPEDIKYNRVKPRVMFTGLRLFNEEVKVGQEYNGHVVLDKAVAMADKVVLNYKQNVFSVQFASDNYVLPGKTDFFYKLEGFDIDWMASSSGMRQVTYTNLAPGTYTLLVKAVNSDSAIEADAAALKIVIQPPFWLTPWAYLFYVVCIAGLIFLGLISVQRRERNKFRLRQIQQEAARQDELNQMKFRFFTNVSHELRTPLTLIISPLESMLKEPAEPKQHERLELMYRNARRLLALVNQLLDFRKNEMNGSHLSLSKGDMVDYVRNICNSFCAFSEKKNVSLTFRSSMNILNMSFDRDKIGKVVMNLLSNAFKFTPEGGRVDVSLDISEEKPGFLQIKVADTGIGIKDEDKKRIFDRFYQVEQKEAGEYSTGSGIGLSLVHDFVTLHHGEVEVKDNVGSGTVFIVQIPIEPVVEEEAADAEVASARLQSQSDALGKEPGNETADSDKPDSDALSQAEHAASDKPLVLIVEDNEDLVAFMKDVLSLYFQVTSASNGLQAWNMLASLKPAIIVTDVMMPEMDGNELCRRVKADERLKHIPVILLTARQTVEAQVESLGYGADDYMTKPFNVEVLLLRMRKLIELNRQEKPKNKALIEPEPSEIVITSLDEKLIENAIRYVEENMSRGDLSVEELSHELGMSRVHLYKKLLQVTGKTPTEFIRIIRLKRAAQFLRESQMNVSEIAYTVGFNSPKYFSKYFKEEFGVLPSVYQDREGKITNSTPNRNQNTP